MKKYFKTYFLVILAILLISGCGIWRDFTGYFNGYFNAANLFSDAEKQIVKDKKELFTLDEPALTGTTSQNLTKVIEKLSKLLQFNPKSHLVDDALLMIGKAFYYQKNYQKAIRKFEELQTTHPESGLVLESRLWVVKSYFRINDFTKGLEVLSEVYKKAEEEKENSILVSAYVEEISYLIAKDKVDEAITKCNKLVEVSHNGEKNAAVMYELGKLYHENGSLENSAKAYAKVQDYSPDFETEYNARLEYGKVERELGQYQKAYEVFEGIRGEQIYNENLDKTDLEIGITLTKLEKTEDAYEKLKLVDTAYTSKPSSGIASYYLGELLEKKFSDLDSAKYYYQRTSSSSAPVEIKDLAAKKVQVLNKLSNLHSTISDYSRKLMYLVDSTAFIKDSLAFVREQARVDSLNKEYEAAQNQAKDKKQGTDNTQQNAQQNTQQVNKTQQQSTNRQGNRNNRDGQTANAPQLLTNKLKKPERPLISVDSINIIIAKYKYELAGLFFTEINMPDSAKYYYMDVINNYPNSPYMARTLFAMGTYYSTLKDKQKADSLFEIVYEKYQDEKIANVAAQELNKPLIEFKLDPADSLYKYAESKIKAENYKEAVSDFIKIYRKYPASKYAPKALYASGWLLENKLDMQDSAAVIYDSLSAKFANSLYANAVKTELNIYKIERRKNKERQDSVKLASTKLANDSSGSKINKDKIVKSSTTDSTKKEIAFDNKQQPKDLPGTMQKPDSTVINGRRPNNVPADSLKQKVQLTKKDSLIIKNQKIQ